MGDSLLLFLTRQCVQKCVPRLTRVHVRLPPNLVPTMRGGSWDPKLEHVRTPGLRARGLRGINRVNQDLSKLLRSTRKIFGKRCEGVESPLLLSSTPATLCKRVGHSSRF